MKPKSSLRHFLCIASSSLLAIPSAHAASGTWTGISGAWSDTTDPGGVWAGGIVADDADFTANFTGVDITAGQAINLSDIGRTIGNITFTDSTTSSNDLTISGANILTLDRTDATQPTVDVTQSGRTLNINSKIAGDDGMLKSGAGACALGGDNTYTGTTTVSGGRLILTHLNGIATSSAVSVASGTSLQLNAAGTYANTAPISIVGTGLAGQGNPGALNFGSGGITTSTLNAPLTLGGATTISSFGVTMNQTLGGAVGGTGPLMIDARGGAVGHLATWTLNAQSTYSGNTTIFNDDGLTDVTVKLGVANALPTTTSLNLQGGTNQAVAVFTTLDLNGFDQTLAGLTDTGSVQNKSGFTVGKRVINSSGTLATLTINTSGAVTYGSTGTRVLAGTIGGTTAAGVAANNLALTKTGGGTLSLGGANTHSGGTFINAGGLFLRTELGGRLGSGTVTVASGGNTNYEIWAPNPVTLANNIILNGATGAAGRPALNHDGGAGKVTLSGTVTLNATSDIGIGGSSWNDMEITGVVSGPGGMIVNEKPLSGANRTLILSGPNIYTGPTTVTGGTLKAGVASVANVSGAFGNNSAVTLSNAAGGTLDIAGFDTQIGSLTGGGASGGNVTLGAATLTVGGDNTSPAAYAGAISGTGGVTKIGSGIQILSGTNTYTGGTTVSDGTLQLGGSNTLVDTGAILIGGATLNAATTGTETAGTLDVTAAATINLGSGAQLVFTSGGTATWAGSLNITGDFVSGVSLNFGSSSGLTSAQLAAITLNGVGGTFTLDGTGFLLSGGGPTGFAAWQAANSPAGGINEDHDNDGVSNGIEYFLVGPAPSTGYTALPAITPAGSTFSITWTKSGGYSGAYNTDFVVETSATLADPWTTEAPGVNVTLGGNDVTYTFPEPLGSKRFARLKVTGP